MENNNYNPYEQNNNGYNDQNNYNNQDNYNGYNGYDANNYNGYNYQPQVPEKKDGKAIASLVMGILSLVCCGSFIFSIIGVILGGMSYSQKKENNGMAVAGLVLSIIGLVVSIIAIIYVVAAGGTSNLIHIQNYG